jgi:hypothetical protein
MKNREFYRRLHARGLDTKKLAAILLTSRPHLTDVLNNVPGHGFQTRQKLFLVLTPAEIKLLGWAAEYRRWRYRQKKRCSTGNIVSAGVRQMVDLVSRAPEGAFS